MNPLGLLLVIPLIAGLGLITWGLTASRPFTIAMEDTGTVEPPKPPHPNQYTAARNHHGRHRLDENPGGYRPRPRAAAADPAIQEALTQVLRHPASDDTLQLDAVQ